MPSLPPLLPGFLVALGIGLLIGIDRERHKGTGPTRQAAGLRTFSLAAIAGATAQHWFGEAGLLVATATAGFADTHSAGISVAELVAENKITAQKAVTPILAAFTTNTITKMVFAVTTGGRAFALYVIPGLILMAIAAWAGAFIAGPVWS